MYGLTEQDRRIRDTARAFVETLMPHEVEAELAGGILPKELTAEHQARAIELGLYATNMPASVGGPGCTALQQVLVQEQCGRVTNGLGWVMATPPQWWVEVATEYQRERWLMPSVRGEKHEAYAITEEFAGSDVSALQTTARRDGDEYVIDGSSGMSRRSTWPTTSSSRRYSTAAITCCWWSTCRGLAWKWFARRSIRITSPTSIRSWRSTTFACRWPTSSGPRADL